ncbi:MAG TPA: YfhO family protein [Hanamia sp.]
MIKVVNIKLLFKHLKPALILLGILLVAYLPLSSFHFAMKNDAFSDNFPQKYFFSESIHSGYFPLWNPYLNFGFPIYADPGFAFWNPITWFWGSVIGYSAFSLTAEVLLYLFISGVTMYYLMKYFGFSAIIAILVSAMYMCSGFFYGSLQYINFLTAAAFLPLLLMNFLKLQKDPHFRNSFLTAISFYMIASGGHPAIPVATLYFLVVVLILIIVFNIYQSDIKKRIFYSLISAGLFILFFLPGIYSYISVLPHYLIPELSSGNKTATFSFSSFISLIFPFSTAGSSAIFQNDVAMRNIYFSIAGFASVFIGLKYRIKWVYLFLISGFLISLLSFGGTIKANAYSHLPLISFIRTNGEFRVFPLLCFCISAGFGLDKIERRNVFVPMYKLILRVILIASIALIIYSLLSGNILLPFKNIQAHSTTDELKSLFSNSPVNFYLLTSGLITLFFTVALLTLKKTRSFWFPALIIADLIINAIIFLPVTGIGRVTLPEIQSIYNQNPKGFPMPSLIPLNEMKNYDKKTVGLVGDKSFYDKQIGIKELTGYPSYLKTTDAYLNSTLKLKVEEHPFLFLLSDLDHPEKKEQIKITHFSPSQVNIEVASSHPDTLIFLQNYYPFWNATANGKTVPIKKELISFMSIPINTAVSNVVFFYKDPYLIYTMSIAIISFLTCLFFSTRKSISSES